MNPYAQSHPMATFWRKTVARPLPPHVPKDIYIIHTREEYSLFFQMYGVPNAIDIGHGVFSAASGSLFIDDFTGTPVAFAWPFETPKGNVKN